MILKQSKIDLMTAENRNLVLAIFAAKEVPVELIGRIANYKEFHQLDWPSVEATVAGKLKPFDDYFNYVVQLAQKLESLREK